MAIAMARRTIYLPPHTEALARANQRPGESFSATVSRLIEEGVRANREADDFEGTESWIGSFEGPGDLGINAEKYLGLKPWEPDD